MMNQGGNVVKRDTGESVTNTVLSNMQKSIESLTQSVNHFSTKQQVILSYLINLFILHIHALLNYK